MKKYAVIPKVKSIPTIQDLIDNYLNLYLPHQNTKDDSMHVARANCKNLSETFGGMIFNEIKVLHIIKYIQDRKSKGVSNNTIRRELSVLRSTVQRGLDFEIIDSFGNDGDYSQDWHSAKRLMEIISKHRPKGEKRKIRPTFEQVEKIMENLDEPMKRLVFAAYHTAYRKGELLGLTFGDLNLPEKELRISDSKTGEPRTTPLYRELFVFFNKLNIEAVRKYGKDKINNIHIFPIQKYITYQHWRKACIKAGIVDDKGKALYHFHDLRKTAIRYLKEVKKFSTDMIVDAYSGHHSKDVFDDIYNIRSGDSYIYYKDVALNS